MADTGLSEEEPPNKRLKTETDVFPGGQVLLIVGSRDKKVTIRVSEDIISAASENFAKQLRSIMIEGQSKRIELPHDDPDTVLVFCKLVHFQMTILDPCDAEQLIRVAEFADMRFCANALKVFIERRPAHVMPAAAWPENLLWEVASLDVDKPLDRNLAFLDDSLFSWRRAIEFGGDERQNPGLTVGELVNIAAIFQLDGLFWHATRIAIVIRRPVLDYNSAHG